ncbi:MAG: hypothetical protein ACRDD8_11310 [Bacteroidales bacterium]
MGKKIIAYHGSPTSFDKFSSKYMGTTGTAEGFGFYFTTSPEYAKFYTNENTGFLYTCELDIKGLLSNEKVMIKRPLLTKIIKHLDTISEGMYLSNYGDVEYEGYNTVLRECIDTLISTSESDVDIFGDCVNSGGSFDEVANAFIKFGYNSLIVDSPTPHSDIEHQIIVMINADDIHILKRQNLMDNANESYKAKTLSEIINENYE